LKARIELAPQRYWALESSLVSIARSSVRLISERYVSNGMSPDDGDRERLGVGDVDGQPVDEHGLYGLLRLQVVEQVGGNGFAEGGVANAAGRASPAGAQGRHDCR
jgi:hypothetical protein